MAESLFNNLKKCHRIINEMLQFNQWYSNQWNTETLQKPKMFFYHFGFSEILWQLTFLPTPSRLLPNGQSLLILSDSIARLNINKKTKTKWDRILSVNITHWPTGVTKKTLPTHPQGVTDKKKAPDEPETKWVEYTLLNLLYIHAFVAKET